MSGIHPVSAMLLIGFGVLVLVSGVAYLVHRAIERRRYAVEEEVVIDLTHFHSATEAFRQATQELVDPQGQGQRTGTQAP